MVFATFAEHKPLMQPHVSLMPITEAFFDKISPDFGECEAATEGLCLEKLHCLRDARLH
jgi:hypothetical protein